MSIRPLEEQKCLLDIQMSIRPLEEQKCPLDIQMSIRALDKQECPLDIQMSIRPLDIQMSIRPLDKQKCPIHMGSDSVRLRHYSFLGIVNVTCPLDVNKCPFVHCTNRNVHSSI